ncbi:MAG: hypothetical protein ACWA5L_01545 [bacterium]
MLRFLTLLTVFLSLTACASNIKRADGPRVQQGIHYQDCSLLDWGDPANKHPQAFLDPTKVIIAWGETCDVEGYTIAVKDNGELRSVYGKPTAPPGGHRKQFLKVSRNLIAAAKATPDGEPVKIIIFAHGGMTTHGGAIADAERLAPVMIRDGYFPIFLVWNSDFENSYKNYLCCVANGVDIEQAEKRGFSLGSLWYAPTRITGDLGAGIFRAPENYIGQVARFQDSVQKNKGNDYFLTRKKGQDVNPKGGFPNVVFPPFKSDKNLNDRSNSPPQKQVAYYALFPIRMVTTSFSEAGTSAWDNMVRRTRLAFRAPAVFTPGTYDPLRLAPEERCAAVSMEEGDSAKYGSFSLFLTFLDCQLKYHPDLRHRQFEITFVGHSMGAIVGNEMAHDFPDLPYKRIIFMGAATSIRDTQNGVFKLLEDNPDVEFYNLMLHPLSESRELPNIDWIPGGVVPQGSLLEWIDEMFEKPRSREERMIGKWLNVKSSKALFPTDLSRVHMRIFAAQRKMPERVLRAECDFTEYQRRKRKYTRCHPVAHADFKLYSFWRDAFLEGRASLPDGTRP